MAEKRKVCLLDFCIFNTTDSLGGLVTINASGQGVDRVGRNHDDAIVLQNADDLCDVFFVNRLTVEPEDHVHLLVIALNFFASAKNFASPLSVNGCFKRSRIDESGHVATSAPASAHFTMCRELRIDAARTC